MTKRADEEVAFAAVVGALQRVDLEFGPTDESDAACPEGPWPCEAWYEGMTAETIGS